MDAKRAWILVAGILVIMALTALGIVLVIRETIQSTVRPVNEVTGNLSTRVAQVLNPTPTILPDPVTVVTSVRDLARLQTIEYTVEKVITAEVGQGTFGFLFGDRLIFVAHGVVQAGLDLEKLRPEDLRVENGVLYVDLPEPEVFIATLDNDKSYVYNRDTGVFSQGDVNLESSARRAAEEEIRKAAVDDGILNLARQNGENYLYRLLRDLGFQEVIFEDSEFVPVTPPAGTGSATPTP
jgi:hypothetical protein